MLNKLIQKRKIVLVVSAIVLWTLTLIFGNGADKVKILVLSLILPFVIYGFVRLMFKVVRINATIKFINFVVCFFFIMGVFSVAMSVIYFITDFPNGLSPALTACLGMMLAVLDEVRKSIEIQNKK